MKEATALAKEPRTQADELEDRLVDFSVRIVRLSAALPRRSAGRHIGGQILRSGTSPAPNYAEARGAESTADFIHKVKIVFKELNETLIWLRVIQRSQLLREELINEILSENLELCKIFAATLRTTKQK